jgi:hypothetical protein
MVVDMQDSMLVVLVAVGFPALFHSRVIVAVMQTRWTDCERECETLVLQPELAAVRPMM